jgi:hypothetical protein
MLPRTSVQVCPGPYKKRVNPLKSFADSVTKDVISKGVLHFINLPVGEGGDGGSPKNKRKGGGVGAPAAVDT